MLTDGTWTYTWEHGRQLASMSDGNTTWTYTYDNNGMRSQRTNGTTTYGYVYNGDRLAMAKVGTNRLYFIYDSLGNPAYVKYNGTVYHYVTNIQGDVIGLVTSDGSCVVQYTYDAWGNPGEPTGSMANTLGKHNPLRYRGYVYDQETGLYYLQSRYYNPEVGRFINADSYASTGQGILGNNMFAYCLNNPVNMLDPSGELAITTSILIAIGIGAVFGGIYGGVSAAENDQDIVAGVLIGAAVGGLTGLITETAGIPLMLAGIFLLGAGGDMASQMILDKKSFGEVNLISMGWAGLTNACLALPAKGLSVVSDSAKLTIPENIMFGSITNSPLLGLGMAINMGISKHSDTYTVNDLIEDVSDIGGICVWGVAE